MATTQEEMSGTGFNKNSEKIAKKLLNEIAKLRDQKEAIQDQINSKFTDLQAEGVEKKAAKRVLTLKKMDEEQLAKEDASEALCRKALGIGAQPELKLVQ